VEQKVNAVLARNTPDWRMQNACPACFYKLKDEPPLEFSYLASIDGNNSLKR
jgi:ferredoxin-like protein FixX